MVAYCIHNSRLYLFHLAKSLDSYSKSVHMDLLHTLHFIESVKYFIVDILQSSNQSPIDDPIDFILDFELYFYLSCSHYL